MPSRRRRSPAPRRRPWRRYLLRSLLLATVVGLVYTAYLDYIIRDKFEGRRWELPAYVYARPLELFPGARLTTAQLEHELRLANYRPIPGASSPGSYERQGDTMRVTTRAFRYWDGAEPARSAVLRVDDGKAAELQTGDGQPLPLLRIDPVVVGRIYPAHREDRVLIKLAEVPLLLRGALIAVEDRQFYSHFGLDPRAIARALVADLRRGGMVQGGSTLTQQLVKNFFLSSERTLTRKLNEAVMALLLEWHYDKDEILETYMNEIYLGQDRDRAIHGFGLASQFYFNRPLAELAPQQIALLVALVKGPSYYDPRRHPERALARRNLVLELMAMTGLLTEEELAPAQRQPLGVTPRPQSAAFHPAFLDLMWRQLRRDYREEDLRAEGLRIFTTLDPTVQNAAEQALVHRLARLEQNHGMAAGSLEGALLVTSVSGGEVQAVVGGREPRYAGFDRALDAERQVGSLIKPVVYLTAFGQPHRYTLASRVDDAPLEMTKVSGRVWQPENYDKQLHGTVPLYRALAHSYNLATVRLGMDLGVEQVLDTLRALGVARDIPPYPAMLLGAMSLTPLEVTQAYQTLAGGGFRTPLRAIREVVSARGEPLKRYPLQVEQAADPVAVYLLTMALQQVVAEGTARGLTSFVPASLHLAGKTGTTDDLRDSWFAGFGGDRLGVVWVGRDNNDPAGLTGASGAMQVWGDLFAAIGARPLAIEPPAGVEWAWIDPGDGRRALSGCRGAVELPFSLGTAPIAPAACAQGLGGAVRRSLEVFRNLSQ